MIDGQLVYSNTWTVGDARIYFYIRSNGERATYEVWQQDDPSDDIYSVYVGEDYTTAELHWDRAIEYAGRDLIRKYRKSLDSATSKVESQFPSWQRDEEARK